MQLKAASTKLNSAWRSGDAKRRGVSTLYGFFAASILIALAAPALAQPAREGNIYDWRDHQPTEGSVRAQERAAGVAPSKAQRAVNGQAVDQLGQQLLHDEAVDPPTRESRPQLSEPPSQLRK